MSISSVSDLNKISNNDLIFNNPGLWRIRFYDFNANGWLEIFARTINNHETNSSNQLQTRI